MDISVKFVDFWPSFDHENNKFVEALRSRHNVTVLDRDSRDVPDILFYSRNGVDHFDYDCLKIYYTGENDFPDFNECDYALSFYRMDFGERHLRYPLYLLYDYGRLAKLPEISDREALERGFCSLLMRNADNCDPMRLRIIDAVDAYRPLAYGGPYRNNTGGPVEDKLEFISRYKFNLALENSDIDGYVTEKVLEPMLANTVPIYWGTQAVRDDFNPEAFVNVGDYDTVDSFVDALGRLDNDDRMYLAMLRAPKLKGVSVNDFDGRLADFLDKIATGRRRHTVRYGEMNRLRRRNRLASRIVTNKWGIRAARVLSKLL